MTDPFTIITGVDGAPNLAIDVLPDNVPGTFLVDVSEVGGPDLLGWGLDGWSNIVCDVTAVRGRRGATRLQGAVTRTEAGTCTVSLIDTDRRFDPIVNADAIHPGTPFRVRVWMGGDPIAPDWSTVLFTGRIGRDIDVAYRQLGAPIVTFAATDVVARLAQYAAIGHPDPGVGAGDDLLERVVRVVEELGLPPATMGTDSDSGYAATLAPTSLTDGWGDVNAAADAELGRVWVTADDQIITRARGSQLTGPVRGTLSDWHGETVGEGPHCCYRDPIVRFGTDTLANRAIGARRVPRPADGGTAPASALVQVDDTYSQARWSEGVPVTYEDRALELETDAQLTAWGEWLLLTSAEPELRVDSVTPDPSGSTPAWRAVCETDIGDRWAFRLHPEVGGTVSRTVGVLGIEFDITPETWELTWTTTEAPTPGVDNPSGWFTVGLSEVGGDDVLPAFGGAVA